MIGIFSHFVGQIFSGNPGKGPEGEADCAASLAGTAGHFRDSNSPAIN
jgi:hypothetical protein